MKLERNFTPRLSAGELPDLMNFAVLLQADFLSAVELWDARMSGYQGLLAADLIGETDALYDAIEAADWRYLQNVQRYRNRRTQETINDRKWVNLRDAFTDAMYPDVERICNEMFRREITLHEWLRRMAKTIQQTHTALWMFGSGGYNTLTANVVNDLELTLREQFDYLKAFANEMIVSNRPDRQEEPTNVALYTPRTLMRQGVINRSTLYIESATKSAEQGRATSYGVLTNALPAYPADGSTECLMRCRCHWRFKTNTGDASYYHAFWRLRALDGKNCQTCLRYAIGFNPFVLWRF